MNFGYINLFARTRAWKAYVQGALLNNAERIVRLEDELARLTAALEAVHVELQGLQSALRRDLDAGKTLRAAFDRLESDGGFGIEGGQSQLVVLEGRTAKIIHMEPGAGAGFQGISPTALVNAINEGVVDRIEIGSLGGPAVPGNIGAVLLSAIRLDPAAMTLWLDLRLQSAGREPLLYFERFDAILADLDRLDLYAWSTRDAAGHAPPPFHAPENVRRAAAAEPKRRSAVFLHNNYYHFNNLVSGLRARGWDALTVSVEPPDSPQRQFYHGEDINLFDPDPAVMKLRTSAFLKDAPERFGALHFYGMGQPSFFPENFENSAEPEKLPWDLLELRRHRVVIGYMPSGCMDGGLQSSIAQLTGGLCNRCVWQNRSDVCTDARNLAWNRKLARICDWVGLECDHATPERIGEKTVYGPVVTTLDPRRWSPDIEIPDDMRIDREPGEILIYHAVGNYAERRKGDRDLKGTGAVMAAVESLRQEGLPVRLFFAHDVPSTRVRFLQVQADIVVDQLNYGRYGANAREAMMLGRPTICRMSPRQSDPLPALRPIVEAPLVDAGEDSVRDVLRSLVLDPELRARVSRRSRAFALAWHGMEACAERYERVIDRIRAGLPPETPELYPPAHLASAWQA